MRRNLIAIILFCLAGAAPASAQQDVASFFKGKQIQVLIAGTAGGGIDIGAGCGFGPGCAGDGEVAFAGMQTSRQTSQVTCAASVAFGDAGWKSGATCIAMGKTTSF